MDTLLMVLVTAKTYLVEWETWTQTRTRHDQRGRDERGEGGVSYLLILLGAITIAGLIIAAVTAYVTRKNGELQ
ncbi:MAG: hypothetical protein ABIR82_03440 [Nocardioides sp.]